MGGDVWLLAVVAWAAAGFGRSSLPWLLVGVIALDASIQGQRILNQAQMFSLDPTARSRLNTAYVTGNFIGGAIGSIAAVTAWTTGGWAAVSGVGAALATVTGLLWLATRLRAGLRRRRSARFGKASEWASESITPSALDSKNR